MKCTQSSAAALAPLLILLLVVSVAPPLAGAASQLSGRPTPPASAAPAGLAVNRIDPPDRGVCVTRPGQPCPRPPLRVQ